MVSSEASQTPKLQFVPSSRLSNTQFVSTVIRSHPSDYVIRMHAAMVCTFVTFATSFPNPPKDIVHTNQETEKNAEDEDESQAKNDTTGCKLCHNVVKGRLVFVLVFGLAALSRGGGLGLSFTVIGIVLACLPL